MRRPFRQVDVFTEQPYRGNPVAVVLDADGLSDQQMQQVARWTNLSETTFVLPPSTAQADYRVRIFTPAAELPFAGHPTLGTCHAWLAAAPERAPAGDVVVQECGAGLVQIRRDRTGPGGPARLAFAAPPLLRSGPVEEDLVVRIAGILGIERAEVLDAEWVDNGPGWVAVLLRDAEAALAVRPGYLGELDLGVLGLYPPGSPEALEVRGFFRAGDATLEDPVTGSLNASVAPWLVRTGRLSLPYVAHQGTALGRDGRVYLSGDAAGAGPLWVGGHAVTCIEGEIEI